MLDEVFIAPLGGEIGLGPLIVDIEQGDVIPSWLVEVLPCRVCVDDLVFWPIEDAGIV